VKFAGVLSENGERFEVRGVRHLVDGNPTYRFSGAAGEGDGVIQKGRPGCPGELHFHWRRTGHPMREGHLASGPCYWF